MPIYQYTIPLEETEDGLEPVYDYPEGNKHTEYEQGEYLVVIRDNVIPHFHKDTIPVKVDVLVDDEIQ